MTTSPTRSRTAGRLRPKAWAPTCRDVVELAPWLLNGSLEEAERRALLEHLATCESCSGELEETLLAWQLFAQHLPRLALAEYSQGVPVVAPERERIERHLAICPSCRGELELATAGRVVDFETARERRAPVRRWARLGVAAAVAAVVASAVIWSRLGPAPPDPGVRASVQEPAAVARPVAGEPQIERSRSADLFGDGFESGSTAGWQTHWDADPVGNRATHRTQGG